jgi:hypothetical protein
LLLSLQTSNYIGEICSYLLATPISPDDKNHGVRLMFGNGLRKNIWNEFVNRGAIHQLLSIILKLRILVLLPVSNLPYVVKVKNYSLIGE